MRHLEQYYCRRACTWVKGEPKMSLKETIRKQIVETTKLRMEAQKNVLKVVLGEIETQESRQGKQFTDEDCCRVVRKTLQGVEEMLQYKPNDPKFEAEKATLKDLLPKEFGAEDLKAALSSKIDELKAAKSDGQATGIAMKFFKERNMIVDGNLVKKVVAEIRAE
jgi:uncharacterized protein YqeY